MAKINLLPWREEQRKERQRQFISITVGALLLMGAVDLYIWLHFDSKIGSQNVRVDYLTQVGKQFDDKIKEIKNIEEEEEKLKKRIKVIETLQSSRPEIVMVFDSLARTLPDGLYLTGLNNAGQSITLQGYAESNATVSNFMHKLDQSQWFERPNLGSIESVIKNKRRMSKFTLKVLRPVKKDEQPQKKTRARKGSKA